MSFSVLFLSLMFSAVFMSLAKPCLLLVNSNNPLGILSNNEGIPMTCPPNGNVNIEHIQQR